MFNELLGRNFQLRILIKPRFPHDWLICDSNLTIIFGRFLFIQLNLNFNFYLIGPSSRISSEISEKRAKSQFRCEAQSRQVEFHQNENKPKKWAKKRRCSLSEMNKRESAKKAFSSAATFFHLIKVDSFLLFWTKGMLHCLSRLRWI